MDTIQELKQQARERENKRLEQEIQRAAENLATHNRYLTMLTDMLKTTAPYGEFYALGAVSPGEPELNSQNNDTQVIVRFTLPEHAEIQARFVFKQEGDLPAERWKHVGFLTNKGYEYAYWVADTQKMWRVSEWTGTGYDPESEHYRATYRTIDFADLGEALLSAERAYRDPADIQREVDDHNRAAKEKELQAAPPPEPTASERLGAAIKEMIQREIQLALGDA